VATILVVDDNRDIADAIGALLKQCGYQVWVVYDGQEALSNAAVYLPEAVLLDIGILSIDGIEVARQLRKTQGNSVRIVACTGYAQEAIRDQLRDAPFDVILQKPVALETILDALTGSA